MIVYRSSGFVDFGPKIKTQCDLVTLLHALLGRRKTRLMCVIKVFLCWPWKRKWEGFMFMCSKPGVLIRLLPVLFTSKHYSDHLLGSSLLKCFFFSSTKLASMHNSVFINQLWCLTKFLKRSFGLQMRYKSAHPQGGAAVYPSSQWGRGRDTP